MALHICYPNAWIRVDWSVEGAAGQGWAGVTRGCQAGAALATLWALGIHSVF
jgi:hypothetical protein